MPFSDKFAEYILSTSGKTFTKEASEDFTHVDRMSFYKQSSETMNNTIHKLAQDNSKTAAQSLRNVLLSDSMIVDEMSKFAGLMLHRTEPEDIEQFLKEYMYNELSFFPDKLNITIDLKPMDSAPAGANSQQDIQVLNATGTVNIEYYGAMIQLPFIMQDKEILPFDTIQLGTERAVYTRENIRNILFNIKRKNESLPTVSTPYAANVPQDAQTYMKTDKFRTSLTDSGFMGDMLQIQSVIGKGNQSMYGKGVYASIDSLLEKTAELEVKDINDVRELQRLTAEYRGKAEKVANMEFYEDPEMAIRKQAAFDDLQKQEFADIQALKDGQKFTFTEKEGNILSNTNAELHKLVLGVAGIDIGNRKLVITADGRFKLLYPGERFVYNLGIPGELLEPVQFERHYTNVEGVNPGRMFTMSINGAYLTPFTVTKVISGGEMGFKVSKIIYCLDVNNDEYVLIPLTNISNNEIVFKSKDSILSEIAKLEDPKVLTKYNLFLKRKVPVACIAEDTPFIELTPGAINNVENAREMMYDFDSNLKLAAFGDVVTISCPYDDKNKLDVVVSWRDKYGNNRKTMFGGITETKVLSILRRIGYDYNKASSSTMKAKKEGVASLDILREHTPWMVRADITAPMAANRVLSNLKDSMFNAQNAKTLLSGLFGGILANESASNNDQSLVALKRFADESAALATHLEKAAIKYENEQLQKLASLMVIDNRMSKAINEAMNGKYIANMEVFAELKHVVPVMEKLAYDLVELKLSQAINKNELLSPNIINGTLRHMDSLAKCATMFGPEYDSILEELDAKVEEAKKNNKPITEDVLK